MSFIFYFLITLFLLLCLMLCFVIMIQDSKSSGLGASFGGDSNDSLFGTSTADVLKQFTAWTAAIFLGSCLILSLWTQSMARAYERNSVQFPSEIIEK